MSITSNTLVKLKFKKQDGEFEYHHLELGSNVIGRNKPSFITDARISRKHAEIIISELGNVTFNQIGTNSSILLRPETEAIKLQKGVFHSLQSGDSVCLYDGAQPFTVVIDKYEPMQIATLEDNETIATQELDNDHVSSPLNYLKESNQQQVDVINANKKRVRDDEKETEIKKLKYVVSTPDKSQQVLVEDSLKINIVEEELTFVKTLGSGACGQVSQYEWKGTPVAVKIIYKSLLHKDKKGEFEKETQILKCLRHPNVVLFMGTCTVKGNLAIVTEYLNRGSLRDVLNSPKPIDWNTKIKMAIDVAQGMNYLHHYNPRIIHRDLKSVNLLVDNNFNVKVSDFGLSRFISGSGQESAAKTFCGTLPFIAPEVFAGKGYSTQADVFSFGIVLWEILTHQQPTGNTASTTLGHPEIPSNCPIPFSDLIKTCCSRNPDNRPNFTQILQSLKSMILIESDLNNLSNSGGNRGDNINNTIINPSNNIQPSNNNFNNNNTINNTLNNTNNNNNNVQQQVKLQDYIINIRDLVNVSSIRREDTFELLKGIYKDKPVSIKKLNSKITDFEKKQLDVIAKLTKSPFIQEFYGVVYNDSEHAIIGEYCENDTLYQMMINANNNNNFKFTWKNSIEIAIQMAKSINILHKHSPPIFHRGITSGSFLLDKDYQVKITDFGLSRFNIHENSASLGEIKGNFFYSPPELLNSKKFSQKSDVYSYAIVLWELLQTTLNQTYQKPFYHVELEYDFQIIHQTSKFNKRPKTDESHIPKEFQKLLQQSWDAEPMLRPDFDKIIEELQNIKSTSKLFK